MSEQRRSERHQVSFQMVFDDGESYNAGRVDDISDTGLFLESPKPLAPGTVVQLSPVDDDEDALFEVRARVIRCEELDARTERDGEAHYGLSGIALEFLDLDEIGRGAVHTMIDRLLELEAERKASGIRDPFLGIQIKATIE